ncbi:amidohydrolase family protein [Marinihelvus fidelis]|uniref:Amidohydrolase family protein n=1 Tax=Marinihelvus fidelis TaxID=2613842 RepID=A0A5N0TG08_9GAMM|nr:amidohydrolase family protein [Marinihelvus fidelis]KAA9134093.1 amidohydrolase family protein [Marinihelvus fidelis]
MPFLKFTLKVVTTIVALLLLVLAVGAWWPIDPPVPEARPDRLVITGAIVVDVRRGQLLAGYDVLIEGGQITAVGPGLPATGATVIDGQGGYLVPGLFDMHVHSMEMSPVLTHPLFIAAGVTAVRDMGGCLGDDDGWAACAPQKRDWHRAVGAGELVGPRYDQVTSLAINGGGEVPKGYDRALGAPDADGARQRVAHDAARGVDFLKPYNRLSREAYLALAESAAQNGLYLAGHHPLAVPAVDVVAAGQRSIEHALLFAWSCYPGIDELRNTDDFRATYTNALRDRMMAEHDEQRCANLHQRMRQAGTAFVPTHTTRKMDAFAGDSQYRNDPRLAYIPGPLRLLWNGDADNMLRRGNADGDNNFRAFYEFGLAQTGAAHRAGVTVLAGTDAPDSFVFPGLSMHDELAHLVQAGLSPLDALRAATLEPARFLGLEGSAGEITPGARADLVLLRENPLEDIQAIRAIDTVVLAGAPYSRERLDQLLAGVEDAAGSWTMWPKFTWQIMNSPVMKAQFGD